nr:putative disease resistance rpp13-like protein 1 [Quercus suber]
MEISRRTLSSRIIKSVTSREVDYANREESTVKAAVPMEGSAMEDVGNVEDAVSGETRMTTENQVSWKHTLVFEEFIRDNDTAINADLVVSSSKVNQPDPTGFQDNNGCDLIEVEVTEDNPMNEKWNLKTKVDKDNVNSSGVASEVGFKVEAENVLHALWKCSAISQVWRSVPEINFSPLRNFTTMSDLILQAQSDGKDVEKLTMVVVLNTVQALQVFTQANHVAPTQSITNVPPQIRWSPPPPNYLNVNFDGATFKDIGRAGISAVIHDNRGQVIASLSEQINLSFSSDMVEAQAAAQAISFALEIGCSSFILEVDSKSVIKTLDSEGESFSPFGDSINRVDEEEVSNSPRLPTTLKDLSLGGHKRKRFPSFRETMKAYGQEPTKRTFERSNSSDDSRNEMVETNVLEMLQPHKNMKKIIIKDFGGTKFPSWIGFPLFSNLILLSLSYCRECSYLPPLGQLPSLKHLTVEGMERIKGIGIEFYRDGCSFPSLETLKFDSMLQWKEWSSSGVEGKGGFSYLQKIEICNCPKLTKLPHHFPALKRKSIKRCEELATFPRLLTIDDNLEQGRDFLCLLELSIWACPNLRELPHLLSSLAMFEIDGCQVLAELPRLPSIRELEVNKFFQKLATLEELRVAHLGELTTLSKDIGLQNLPCFQRLEISGCPFLEESPQRLYKISSHKELRVSKCPSLVSFPGTGLPSTLISLEIIDCDALQFLPEWKMQNNENESLLLEYLVIEGCSFLTSLPRGQLASTLKQLEIHNCMNLESVPEQMISQPGAEPEILLLKEEKAEEFWPKIMEASRLLKNITGHT